MAGLSTPLSTLRDTPHGMPRMTRGPCDALSLHSMALAPFTPCRFHRRANDQRHSLGSHSPVQPRRSHRHRNSRQRLAGQEGRRFRNCGGLPQPRHLDDHFPARRHPRLEPASALSSNGTLRILDAQGRELSRTAVAAGSRSGNLGLSSQGLRFLVLESASASYSAVLPALR